MATVKDYKEALKKLAPRGSAWPTDDSSTWVKLLSAMAEELARIDAAGYELLEEIYPDTTLEMLPDWERVAGLPDPCTGPSGTIQERRADLKARLTMRGGQSRQYFIDLAASLGYVITIIEFDAFRVGSSCIGDPLNSEEMEFSWRVNTSANTTIYFEVGVSCIGEALSLSTRNARLECVIRERCPAHTIVYFNYSL